jgi:sigma-54 dependent transcriptional regulator, acetoin dehydrogenase operon transcriptional activator AcoR
MLQSHPPDRLRQIAHARQAVMVEGRGAADVMPEDWYERGWIERSWRRCLANGRRPGDSVAFDVVPAQAERRAREANHELLQAARPVLDRLSRAIAHSRYFAILTDSKGVVIDVNGVIDRSDPRAGLITRIGVDLSERAVGTSAIGAALAELQPVWLHRGEHFFDVNGAYSCAGAPVMAPDGHCVGMLDLTGIDAAERPELKHLAGQATRSIENALTLALPHRLLLRLNWPGRSPGGDEDGLLCLDDDGWVVGSNQAARQMVPRLAMAGERAHCSELFAQPWTGLFDLARQKSHAAVPIEIPLWSGLRLQALPQQPGDTEVPFAPRERLRDVEIALIRKAVADARGNVMQAAKNLGISRATVYRKLGAK